MCVLKSSKAKHRNGQRLESCRLPGQRRRRHPGSIMITYRLKDNVVTHFPAIFKELGSKPSVIHLALDVELQGGVLAARVAGGRPIDCGKCSRRTVVDLTRELVRRKHRVVLVEEACGFGYA